MADLKTTLRSASKQRQLDAIRPYQWKPGQSGNPTGRPKRLLSDRASQRLEDGELEDVVEAWLSQAKSGDMTAIRELLNRLEGATPTSVAVDANVSAQERPVIVLPTNGRNRDTSPAR